MSECYAGSAGEDHFLLFFVGFFCGVDGLPVWIPGMPPYWYLAFFSDGFKICRKKLFISYQILYYILITSNLQPPRHC